MINLTNQRKYGIILSYVGRIFSTIISLAYTPWMLRLLGQAEYGLYQATGAVISWLGLLSLGFGGAYVRFYSQYKAKENLYGISRLNGLFMMFYSLIAIIAIILGWILSFYPEIIFGANLSANELNRVSSLLRIMAIGLAVNFIDVVFVSYITVHEKFVYQSILSIVNTALHPIIGLPLLCLGYGALSLSIVSLIISVSTLICDMYISYKINISFGGFIFDKKLFKSIFCFTILLSISSIAGSINNFVDTVLLARLCDTESVAIYDIGSKFNLYLMGFSITIFGIFIPKVNIMVAEGKTMNDLTELMIKVGRMQFLIISFFYLAFLFLGRFFVHLYAGEEYNDSYYIACLIIAGSFIPYFQNLGIEIQKALNKHMVRALLFLLIAIINVLISIPLIIKFRAIGAAVGTFIALILGNTLFMNYYYAVVLRLNMSRFWKEFAKPIFATVFMGMCGWILLVKFPVRSILSFVICGIIYSASFVIINWCFVISQEEKKYLLSLFYLKKGCIQDRGR